MHTDSVPNQIEFSVGVSNFLDAMPKEIQQRIQDVATTLQSNPLPLVSRKLVGFDANRIRVNDYRIVKSIHENILIVKEVSFSHCHKV